MSEAMVDAAQRLEGVIAEHGTESDLKEFFEFMKWVGSVGIYLRHAHDANFLKEVRKDRYELANEAIKIGLAASGRQDEALEDFAHSQTPEALAERRLGYATRFFEVLEYAGVVDDALAADLCAEVVVPTPT